MKSRLLLPRHEDEEEQEEDPKEQYLILVKKKKKLYIKAWKINVGRVELYLLDSDIDENPQEYRNITQTLLKTI